MLVGLSLVGGSASAGGDHEEPGSRTQDPSIEPLSRGLAWIAGHCQHGRWGEFGEQGTGVADTALSLLALMAGGNTLGAGTPDRDGIVAGPSRRGPYADKVQEGLDFLARLAWSNPRDSGYIAVENEGSQMHGHGFAALALATAAGGLGAAPIADIRARVAKGISPAKLPFADRVRYGLELAVRLSERAQDPDTGGWYYTPNHESHEGSMTVTQITALRAAMEAGVAVNGAVMKKAVDYVRKSQNTTHKDLAGGFAYQTTSMSNVKLALTAAALTTFFGLGHYGQQAGDRTIIENAMSYVDRRFDEDAFDTVHQQFYYYRLFYLAQALYLSGDERRRDKYWPRIRDDVLQRQNADGSFPSRRVDDQRSPEYCTAMGCLILEAPQETLPIFQRR